jgi:hypothetical protein
MTTLILVRRHAVATPQEKPVLQGARSTTPAFPAAVIK